MTAIWYLSRNKWGREAKGYMAPTNRRYWEVYIDHKWRYERVLTINFFDGTPSRPPGRYWEIDELSPSTGETIWRRPPSLRPTSPHLVWAERERELNAMKKKPPTMVSGRGTKKAL